MLDAGKLALSAVDFPCPEQILALCKHIGQQRDLIAGFFTGYACLRASICRAAIACVGHSDFLRLLLPLCVERQIVLRGICLEVPQLIIAARFVLMPTLEYPAVAGRCGRSRQLHVCVHTHRLRQRHRVRVVAGTIGKGDKREVLGDGQCNALLERLRGCVVAAENAACNRSGQLDLGASRRVLRHGKRCVIERYASRKRLALCNAPCDGFLARSVSRFDRCQFVQIVGSALHEICIAELDARYLLEGFELDLIGVFQSSILVNDPLRFPLRLMAGRRNRKAVDSRQQAIRNLAALSFRFRHDRIAVFQLDRHVVNSDIRAVKDQIVPGRLLPFRVDRRVDLIRFFKKERQRAFLVLVPSGKLAALLRRICGLIRLGAFSGFGLRIDVLSTVRVEREGEARRSVRRDQQLGRALIQPGA